MPTAKPRILVTLDQEDFDLLKRVSEANGCSMASIVREYVEMSRPMLSHLADLADSFRKADQERRIIHMEAAEKAIEEGQAMADQARGQISLSLGWLDTISDLARNATLSGEPPTSSNTGVRSRSQVQQDQKRKKIIPPKKARKNTPKTSSPRGSK